MGLLAVGPSPDIHLLSFLDQFIPEIRMSDADQCFRSLPCGHTLQIHLAELCNNIHGVGPGICHNTAGDEGGADTGSDGSVLLLKCG